MESEIKAGLRRRSSRRVNMMARRNPARAPRNPSVIERLLKVRRPWPVRRNPVYAITTVQTIARTFTGPHTSAGFSKVIALCLPRHTYITSAQLAMEIQGTPYAVDNQNRLPGMQGGAATFTLWALPQQIEWAQPSACGRTTLGWEVIWRAQLLPCIRLYSFIERAGGTAY